MASGWPHFAAGSSDFAAGPAFHGVGTEYGLDLIRKASPGSAGRNRTLAIDRFEALQIPLPPLNEQRQVAQRLDRLSRAAAELGYRLKLANELSQGFTVSISARPDINDVARSKAGWRKTQLAEILEMNNHEVDVVLGGNYRIAGVYSFGRGLFERRELSGTQTSYKKLYRLEAGQLVMSRLKAWEGALAIVPGELEGSFVSSEFPTFDVDTEQVELPYLEVVLTSESFWSRLKGDSKGIGARRERVSAEKLLNQVIELPPIDEQKSIAIRIERLQTSRLLRQRVEQRIGSLVPAAINQAFVGLS